MTNFADHMQGISHDAVKRYSQGDKLTANHVWEHAPGTYRHLVARLHRV